MTKRKPTTAKIIVLNTEGEAIVCRNVRHAREVINTTGHTPKVITAMEDLWDFNRGQLLKCYNRYSTKQRKTFRTHSEGVEAVWDVLLGLPRGERVIDDETPGNFHFSPFKGKKISKLTATNPRRIGSGGYRAWEMITDGMTCADYKKAVGTFRHLQWDLSHGYVALHD